VPTPISAGGVDPGARGHTESADQNIPPPRDKIIRRAPPPIWVVMGRFESSRPLDARKIGLVHERQD